MNAVTSNREVVPLKVTIRNNSPVAQSGRVVMELPENWEHVSGGEFKDLPPGREAVLAIRCRLPHYKAEDFCEHHRDRLETVRARVNDDTAETQITILRK